VELDEDEVRKHLREGEGYFEPTPEWDDEASWDRLWSFNGPTVLPPTRRRA